VECQRCHVQTCITHTSTNHEHLCENCIVGDITKNFSRWEFACKCGCGFDDIDLCLVHRLQVVRDILDVPITVTSGCRCKAYNYSDEVGGKPASLHLPDPTDGKAKAVDWTVEDEEILMSAGRMLYDWSGGFHRYLDFIHTDIGRKRRW